MTECIVFENETAFIGYEDDIIKKFKILFSDDNLLSPIQAKVKNYKYLSISEDIKNDISGLRATYVVGYKWLLHNELALCVKSKIDKVSNARADITKMFSQCFHSPYLADKMDQVYGVDWEAPKIEIEEKDDELTPIIIVHFLNIVKSLSKKGLKKGYVTVTENLTAKVKGKILVNQTIKHNHFKNRLDKTVCSHQIFTTNCLENQIIKTALAHASRYVYQSLRGSKEIINLLHFDQMMFEAIDTKEVNFSDFRKIKHSPFFKEYKEALRLAEMIFRRIGFSLHQADHEKKSLTKIPPYHIDMTKLFEHYVEMKLMEIGGEINSQFSTEECQFVQRPDFLYKNEKENIIIDAKYKYWYQDIKKLSLWQIDNFRKDLRQLALYAITEQIRTEVGVLDGIHAKKVIVYPIVEGSNTLDFNHLASYAIDGFVEMYKMGIEIPTAPIGAEKT